MLMGSFQLHTLLVAPCGIPGISWLFPFRWMAQGWETGNFPKVDVHDGWHKDGRQEKFPRGMSRDNSGRVGWERQPCGNSSQEENPGHPEGQSQEKLPEGKFGMRESSRAWGFRSQPGDFLAVSLPKACHKVGIQENLLRWMSRMHGIRMGDRKTS